MRRFAAAILLACWTTCGWAATKHLGAGPDKSELIADGSIVFEKNHRIPLPNGLYVAANVFRPARPGRYPVIMSMSVYGKDLATKDHYPQWKEMVERVPDLCEVSSCKYHTWETPDPEVWVREGYVVVRVDAPGAGKSPGKIDIFSRDEAHAYYEAIEWAARQSWSTGKVGLLGISYYAVTQWMVASLQPPSLAAMIPWEGFSDGYRDQYRHGGVLSNEFWEFWYPRNVLALQHGNCASVLRDLDDGGRAGGPDCLPVEELKANSGDLSREIESRPLDERWYRERSADFSKITVPFLSPANWGGAGLHLRGNVEAFLHSASKQKWLEIHGDDHIIPFYAKEGLSLQKQFLAHFLKGEQNGWDRNPPVMLKVRHHDDTYTARGEREWPLARTQWTKAYFTAQEPALSLAKPEQSGRLVYRALGDGLTLKLPPFERETEITGPLVADLWVSSSTRDMDLFATLLLLDPSGKEIAFRGSADPAVPLTQGWLRLSQRKLDSALSKFWRPWYTHDTVQPMNPGEVYNVQVEIWPTSIVVPKDYTLALRVQGKDFNRKPDGTYFGGSSIMYHNNRYDRPVAVFGGENTIHTGADRASHLLLPVIPKGR